MADDMTYPTPPQPTAIPGTGSAVQVADMDGVKWKFDDKGGNWVNLETGEAVTPKTFAQMAGRSGDAARDTMALAQAMRREEAALTPPPRAPVPRPAAPPVAIAPPTTQTATLPPAPIASPQATPILPPYSPQELQRVQAQQPVPSTRVPPSEGAQTFYKMQQVDWLMRNRGMKPADAMKMVGIGQAPMVKPMTQYQQESIDLRKRAEEAKAKALAATGGEPIIKKIDDRYSAVYLPGSKGLHIIDNHSGETKQFTPIQAASLLTKITKEEEDVGEGKSSLSDMKDQLTKIVRTGVTAKSSAVTPPANAKKEVTRTTKDGRKAVFDADTKKFLRYAD